MPTLAIIWRAAGLLYATGVESVVEVLPPLACIPAAGVPGWVRGLFSHRGRLLPLVDVTVLLGGAAPPDRMANRVLVMRCELGDDSVACEAGLWVDEVIELERLEFSGEGAHPGFETDAGRFLGPVVRTRWGQVQLVSPRKLFTPEQGELLSARLKEAAA